MEIKNVKIGTIQIDKIYVGDSMTWQYEAPDITAPVTTIYPSSGTHYAGDLVRFEVTEMCTTYYTLDGSEPTTGSTKYIEPIAINTTTTIKYFSVDLAGNTEAVKTTVFTIADNLPVTTISPSTTVQNNIPITITLSAINATTIYYKIGSASQQVYSAPFQVTQNTSGVGSVNIPITYWSEGAGGIEAQRTITYNTAGADPVAPVVSVINGNSQVILNWAATQNSLSYTVYRSTVQGSQGSILAGTQYMTGLTWTDTTALNGTTYYYTVVAGNFGLSTPSAQVTGVPTANIYSTDFGTQIVGSAPNGWTSRWVTGSETMTVVSDVTAPSGKVMRYSTTVDNNRRFWSWDDAPTYTGDWDMVVKWKISGLGIVGDIPIRAMAEGRGSTIGQYAYAGDMVTSPSMRIQDYTNNTVSTKATGGGISLSTNTWYWYRFNRTGDTLSLKMWADGSAEPLTWTITATDTTPLTTAGWFGLGFYDNMASATRDIAWFAISMETGGIAPSP